MKYLGVDTDHPTIVNAIRTMANQGKSTEEIMKVVGMPSEVVKRHQQDVKRERKARHLIATEPSK